ncbi:Uncharacterised protein [Raoultella terrigena]|uniref:Uncharacterized protein n=1 Tax=Raoultella terrigena TaxID=577 RepID=A0A3P8KR81_RAOTE|nr:Uncharacterised protein [Raoultella terrigena]
MHAKLLLDIFGYRMNLETQVLPADSVEKIETDRELGAEAGVDFFTQQRAGVQQHQVLRGDLDPYVTKTQ